MAKTGIVAGALWRVESLELVANDFIFFFSLDNTPTGAENLRGGLHAAPVTGNDAVVAVPWDNLAGAGTCLDQSHCVVDASLDWLQV
jgi:hypothetical protein